MATHDLIMAIGKCHFLLNFLCFYIINEHATFSISKMLLQLGGAGLCVFDLGTYVHTVQGKAILESIWQQKKLQFNYSSNVQ